jgi:hypothetical protein
MSGALGSPFDPLKRSVHLDHYAIVYPLGFPLDVQSNSQQVIAAANESWGSSSLRFGDAPHVRLRIVVGADESDALPPEPRFYAHENLIAIVADDRNFVSLDAERGSGFLWVTDRTVRDSGFFRWFFLESAVYLALSETRLTPLHAGCVARNERGMLLLGASGAGKSTLSYACARRGWDFLSDDAVWLLRGDDRRLLAPQPRIRLLPDSARLFPELQNRNIGKSMGGKAFIELDLARQPGVRFVSECEPSACVFLKREVHARAEAEAIDRDEAHRRLMAGLPLGSPRAREEQLHSLERLAEVAAFDFVYDDLDEAVDVLDRLRL